MSKDLPVRAGITPAPPTERADVTPATCVALVTTVALALSTLVAVTAVSIGIARADTVTPGDGAGTPIAIAVFFGLVMAAMGALTALAARDRGLRG